MRTFQISALVMGFLALTSVTTLCQAQGNVAWGTIKGQVIYTKPYIPAPIPVPPGFPLGGNGPLVQENKIIDAKTKGLKNVIVWVRPDTENRKDVFPPNRINPARMNAPPRHHTIDQPFGQYEPRIVAARTGDTLEFKNTSPIAHNVNYSGDPAINITLRSGQSYTAKKPLVAEPTPIPFKSDVFPWMMGRIRVFDHPYFAVTDEEGRFMIHDVPVGNWRLVYWHEDGFNKGHKGIIGEQINLRGATLELKPLDYEFPQ